MWDLTVSVSDHCLSFHWFYLSWTHLLFPSHFCASCATRGMLDLLFVFYKQNRPELINIILGNMICIILSCFYVKMTEIQQSIWLTAAILLLRMKKAESLYDKLLSPFLNFRV